MSWRRLGAQLGWWTTELLADLVRGPLCSLPDEPQVPVSPRYRHPTQGFTWDGRGRQPQWLRDAVLREGYLLVQLRCPRSLAD